MTETAWVDSMVLTRWISTDRSDQNRDKWWGILPHLPSAGLTEDCLVHSVLFQALLHIQSGDFDLCIPIPWCIQHSHNNTVPSVVTAVSFMSWSAESYSDISSWFNRIVWSLGEGPVFYPLMEELRKPHTLQKWRRWIHTERFESTGSFIR